MPRRIVAGTSVAAIASGDRGRARNPMPKAFTKVAMPRPAVSATAPTASGMAIATATSGAPAGGRLWISPWSSSHSETNPLPGGSPDAASAPIPTSAAVTGMRRARPPILSRSRSVVLRSTAPAPRKSRVLKAAWFTVCRSAATIRSPASVCVTGCGKETGAAHADEDQPQVLGGGVGQQPLEVGRRHGLQDSVERGQSTHDEHQQPPPAWAPAEDVEADPQDPVQPQVDHRRRHQRRHVARGLGVCPRQPDVEGDESGLGAEPGEDQHEHQRPRGCRHPLRGRTHARERLGPRRSREEHQAEQDRDETGMCHRGVPDSRLTHLRPGPVLGEDEHQGGQGHQLPQHQEGGDVRRRRNQHHRRHEHRERRLDRPGAHTVGCLREAVGLVVAVGVADAVHAGCDRHSAHDRHEESRQRINREHRVAQRQQPRQRRRPVGPAEGSHTRDQASDACQARQQRRRPWRAPAPTAAAAARDGRRRDARHQQETCPDHAHLPLSRTQRRDDGLGLGGTPGTVTSTGTKSATGPCTPYAPAKTPQSRAQSPRATTRLGEGIAS